jgi:hypothetical protein
MSEAKDGLTPKRWRDFVRWLSCTESIFTDEGETPPAHLRPIAVAKFCKRYQVERHRVHAVLDAWDENTGTLHCGAKLFSVRLTPDSGCPLCAIGKKRKGMDRPSPPRAASLAILS